MSKEILLQEVANRLKQAREQARLTVAAVEENTDLSKGNISSWENAKFFPGSWALVQLSELYEVSIDWILKGVDLKSDKKMHALAEQQKVDALFDTDLKMMVDILKKHMCSENPHMRSWAIVQFEKAFAEDCSAYAEKKLHA